VKGLAVLAHPIESGAEALVPSLAAAGLDGLECYYHGYAPEQVERLVKLAREHDLVPTGGSDYHGFPMSGMVVVENEPGSVTVPPSVVDELLTRRRQRFG
jgi:predicted metal-dependent phosphoesterase TrpH